MEERIISDAIDIVTPVMESSMIVAAEYAKACGRDCVTAMDMKYGMCYAARNLVGKHIGTMFPEIHDQESDSEDEIEIETVDEEAEGIVFTRYDGDDKTMNEVTEAFDTWDQWEPVGMIEVMLKNAVDNH